MASPCVELRTPGVAPCRSYPLTYHINCRGMFTHAQQHPLFIKNKFVLILSVTLIIYVSKCPDQHQAD